MVKKLLKYELISYIRSMGPFCLIVLAIGLLNRIIQLFENDSKAYKIIFTSSIVVVCITLVVLAVMTIVKIVSRFNKNLFSSEGYLSFSLPVTPFEHIIAKLIAALIVTFTALIIMLATGFIATLGEFGIECIKAFNYLVMLIKSDIGIKHLILYIIEIIILFFVVCGTTYTLFYACSSLGQTANKNRTLAAFGYYFLYYLITQVIGTIIIIILNEYDFEWLIEAIYKFAEKYPYGFMHLFLWLIIAFSFIFQAIYFAISHKIIKKHLNLE